MKDISNNTLITFVVLAIVVSVAGTFISLNKITGTGITGYASSGTGTANLTVSSTASITLLDNVIELGTLEIEASNDSIEVDDYWVANNDGSVNISIEVYASTQGVGTLAFTGQRGIGPFNTTTEVGGCLDNSTFIHTCFSVSCNNTDTGFSCNQTYYPLWNETSQARMVEHLDYRATEGDNATFGVNVSVPPDEPAGVKTQTVTFLAVAS